MSLVKTESTNLWENISSLPDELKMIIGEFSRFAYIEKIKIRLQYFKQWSIENVHRIVEMVRTWTKQQMLWLLMKCNMYIAIHSAMNKQTIVNMLKTKFYHVNAAPIIHDQAGYHHGGHCLCSNRTRLVWQRLKAIEKVNSIFEQRKRLVMKQKRDEKKARAKEEQEAKADVVVERVRVTRIHFEGEQYYKSVTSGVVYNTERDQVGIWNEEDQKIEFDAVVIYN